MERIRKVVEVSGSREYAGRAGRRPAPPSIFGDGRPRSRTFAALANAAGETARPGGALVQRQQIDVSARMSAQAKRLQRVFGMAAPQSGVPEAAASTLPVAKTPVQRTLTSGVAAPTVAPLNNGQLTNWLEAHFSASVKRLVDEPQFQLVVTWNDAIPGAVASTDMHMDYTDSTGAAGTVDLFAGNASAVLNGLNYPLANYVIRIPVSVNATDGVDPTSPANIARVTKWRTNLAHELEIHTKLALKVDERLKQMARGPARIGSAKERMLDSVNLRTGDAEHAVLASGGGNISDTFKNIVLAAPAAQQASLVIDAIADRRDHIAAVNGDDHKKLAFRDMLKWLNAIRLQLANLTPADAGRLQALKNQLLADIAAL